MRHLINTFIDGGEKCEKAWLEPKLKESLAKKPNALRLSADVTALLRALAKGVGEGIALYAKGEGAKNFRPWLKKQQHLAQTFYISLNRVDKGVRQDSKTEAAFSAYYNRAVIVEFLKSVHYNKKDNLLRNNLFIMLTCDEIIGAMRGRAAFHDKLTTRLRFFSSSNELDGWSCLNMAEVSRVALHGCAVDRRIARPRAEWGNIPTLLSRARTHGTRSVSAPESIACTPRTCACRARSGARASAQGPDQGH